MDRKQSLPPGKGSGSGSGPESRKRKDPPTATTVTKDASNKQRSQEGSRLHDPRPPAPSYRSAKRVKFQDARNIRTQPSDAALEDGKLDLQRFLNAREFEIKALESSMRKCKAANATRVFQQVPRAMRRRTASHNVKRVPKRLRERARREMIEDNTPTIEARKRRPRTTRARIRAETAKKLAALAATKTKKKLEKRAAEGSGTAADGGPHKPMVQTRPARPKIRRDKLSEPPKATSKFRKRQTNKTWLPTHLWHAKRATMTEPSKPLWRFAVPITPTEKCYRPTHRASGQKGTVAWDMSYMSTIGLYGPADGVEPVLKALGLVQESLWGARGQKWRAGVRKWSGALSRQVTKDSRRDIGPATIVWNPQAPVPSQGTDGDATASRNHPGKRQRQLFIRTHPSCFHELFQELLRLIAMHKPQIHVQDLRFEIGSIELTGPASTETLLGILQPYRHKLDGEEPHARVFKALAGITNPASLPKDALLAFSIKDPRLDYPPKRFNIPNGGADAPYLDTITNWPVEEGLRPFDIFDRDRRFEASRLPSQKSINRRKGANAPGEGLQVTDADPPIPLLLLASRPATDGQAQGTWTLMAPWKCILPIWYALVHYPLSTGGNPRLGGLDEQRQIAFEQGAPWFPADFPATDAGRTWELAQRAARTRDWDRRPKGKRVEWKSLDLGAGRKGEIGDGLACDFEHLFSFCADGPPKPQPIGSSPITDAAEGMDIDPPERSAGTDAAAAAEVPRQSAPEHLAPIHHLQRLTKASFNALLGNNSSSTGSTNPSAPPANSLVTINLASVTRGVANNCARIYRLPPAGPRIAEPSVDAEVLATNPTSANSGSSLPPDLRDQWLRKVPGPGSSKGRGGGCRLGAPRQMVPGVDMEARKAILARSLVTTALPYPKGDDRHQQLDAAHHPLCPDGKDLIGFVTTGAFSLSEGKGTAVGSISAKKALEMLREGGSARERKLCIVRNAGESVGWLAWWEPV
ncbi:ribonucleases P/MRP protein subunit POP1-domain-containing protein [Staphylotrichum tortipilum]|uniref:Ribonucleases P/MRP protein subunit POP1-domain-containing protein n=1 Tax=Staphylotrichum tortipilum TaxID=2831512 RepID=A0AAN6RRT3_9PEZI|nr:ribonucleases P/MRP protein subunit POP1-domain-containing protein [Staphylotrichum longicolle]